MSVRPIREESRCGERGKFSRGMGSIFFGRVAAYMAPSSNRRQDWTCRCVPNAFDHWGENNNQLELSIYWLTSTVSSRSTRSSVKEIVTRYRDHVTAKEGEAIAGRSGMRPVSRPTKCPFGATPGNQNDRFRSFSSLIEDRKVSH